MLIICNVNLQARQIGSWIVEKALLRSLTFWPTAQDPLPILGVGWTLNIEIFFYFLFALSLRAGRLAAPFLSAAVLLALFSFNDSGSFQNQFLATWGDNNVIFFVFGIAVFYVWSSADRFVKLYRPIAVILASLALLYWPASIYIFGANWYSTYAVPPAIVLAVLILHSAGLSVRQRFLIEFGGASYSLYPVHLIVFETLRNASTAYPIFTLSTWTCATTATALSCVAAMVLYRNVELPWLRHARRYLSTHKENVSTVEGRTGGEPALR